MNLLNSFWKYNKNDFIYAVLIFVFLYFIIGAKMEMVGEGIFWLFLFVVPLIIYLVGFIFWLWLGFHKN